MQLHGTSVYRRVDQPGVQIELNSSVAGWDDHTLYSQRVRNYTEKPIDLEVRRTFPGHVIFRSELPAKNHDYQTVEYTATVQACREGRSALRDHPAPGPQRQAAERDDRTCPG